MLCLYDKYIQSDITKKSFNTRYLYTHKKEQKKNQKFHRENIIHTGQIIYRTKLKKNVYICISLMFFRRVVF